MADHGLQVCLGVQVRILLGWTPPLPSPPPGTDYGQTFPYLKYAKVHLPSRLPALPSPSAPSPACGP